MKKTGYGLNLIEPADSFSAKALNENTVRTEKMLENLSQYFSFVARASSGSYTGNDTRTVTIQTPGITPQILILRRTETKVWESNKAVCWWLGSDIATKYRIIATSDTPPDGYEPGEQIRSEIEAVIEFTALPGSLTWTIPPIPRENYDVTSDGGPAAMMNEKGTTFEWIVLGVGSHQF